ncbi:efflux RND transporter periplasmic adaptor subunit [Anaeromicropila populeti]|uniref:HlyD family secretion protein n=1 Tax=Anaeromicropila populeti TaxID=37658 RepID=A0A1I6IWD7_9FIRM|nr:efflux RND transporter periplasmic adaptor subunit [Anaeromicropila populeti]SFR71027.1 HlyD family secretion protein [Anaeromicropila populeti]
MGKNEAGSVDKVKKFKVKSRKQVIIKRCIISVVILALIVVGVRFAIKRVASSVMSSKEEEVTYEVKQVERRDIKNTLSSSGTVQPLNTYSVTTVSSIEGTVISADFEEGDVVEEGDVLYKISTDSLDTKMESAQKSVDRAQESYDKALKKYNEALEEGSDLTVTADKSGYVKSISVEEGDSIGNGSGEILQVYNNKTMLLYLPFSADQVSKSLIGKEAEVELSETAESLKGTVTKVGTVEEVLSGNRIVKYVTIEVENPGGLSVGTSATAAIGDIICYEEGSFSVSEEGAITISKSGEIEKLYVEEGDWITAGDVILKFSSDSYDSEMENYLEQVENAKESLEDATDSLQEVIDSKADFTITSPITGTIIKKNTKLGDTVSNSGGSSSTLCLIYDLSAMTFEMYVDELDVMEVEVGQTVDITADALEGEDFVGVVTNVSLESTTSGGVTQYPVTVRIDETGELLPGMNISGEVVIESAENALTIPSDALQRGNVVYVQDESVTEADGDVPAGFRSVEVETGLSDSDYIEIVSGLSETDMVYVPGRVSSSNDTMMGFQQGQMGGGQMGERPEGGSGGNRSGGGGAPGGMSR